MKILTILGARPQFIKAAAFSRKAKGYKEIEEIIVHTGQHFDEKMSDVFFRELEFPEPRYNLEINSLSQGAMTGRMIEKIEGVLELEKPDIVLIYGDTNSTLAGAIAASKLHIPIAHIEAGLRSFNMKMPEEINRIVTDRLSSILFCPTDTAVQNLHKEGFLNFNCKIVRTGDIMYDVALFYKDKAKKPAFEVPYEFILCTIHRAENTDNLDRLKLLIDTLNEISQEILIICPIHPRTKKLIETHKIDVKFKLVEPVSYLEMIWLLKNCKMVMTDSGGLQKEAYFFEKPALTLRDETEWLELVECGVNKVVGVDRQKILDGFKEFASSKVEFKNGLYGDGNAAGEMISSLIKAIKRENVK